jgi:hypothetical protein
MKDTQLFDRFWLWLSDAYAKQLAIEHGEYVDLYYVADRVCNDHEITMPQFTDTLQWFFPEALNKGYLIALEVDATPTRRAQLARRKHKIIIDGCERTIIALKHKKGK